MGKYEDLEIIKKLKNDGDMTAEEFEIEKQKILSRPDDVMQKGWGLYAACSILGICSLIFGTMGIVYGYSIYIAIIFGISAIVLGMVSRKRLKENQEKNRMVTAGIITGVLGTLISMLIIIMVVYSVVKIYSSSGSTKTSTTQLNPGTSTMVNAE